MILKETLTNTFKHAKASKVTLSIEQYEAQHWLIRITDDGIGYDIKTVERGHGIDNMNNRVKRVKATLKVASQIGQGSTLELGFKLPLK
jgi:signal transduction histidine kinase